MCEWPGTSLAPAGTLASTGMPSDVQDDSDTPASLRAAADALLSAYSVTGRRAA